MIPTLVASVIMSSGALTCAGVAGDVVYDLFELSSLPGYPYGRILDINNHGHAIGKYHTCPFTLSCLSRGFYWDGETLHDISVPILEFVPPGFFGFVDPFRMNDNGDVAVRLAIPDMGIFSFHYLDGVATQIVPFDGAQMIYVNGINELGQLVGHATHLDSSKSPVVSTQRAYVWNARTSDTTTIIDAPKGFAHASASGINDVGVVVGSVSNGSPTFDSRAFVIDDGVMTLFDPLEGDINTYARDITNDGYVLGGSVDASFNERIVLWAPDGSVYDSYDFVSENVVIYLWDINENKRVVGYYWPTDTAAQYFAFVWSADGFLDLNNAIPEASPVTLWEATGVNESGQIAVWGDYPGFVSGGCFILTPINQPSQGDLDGDGDVDFSDLLQLLSAWGTCTALPECFEDLDRDGEVGFADLLILLTNWT